ncbi:hypothetical protein [Rhodopseudomonas palustris]|uniref:hypothetical protein n=1 Tax=Rhodopseudomonas palustris TaxID=1076 RepID=UPI000641F71D|nr:hypothetical protein [Rhodopseudomonas palustris]
MQHHQPLGPADCSPLAKVARDPERLLTVREFWTEFNEPTDLLDDADETFRLDTVDLIRACVSQGIPYADGGHTNSAFPVWLLRDFYPVNP